MARSMFSIHEQRRRADGPTGEAAVSLSVRLEYWYVNTAALPTHLLCCIPPHHAQLKNKCRQHWSQQTKHNNCQPKQTGWYGIGNGCIPTLLLQKKNIHGRTVISRFQHNNTINCKHLDEAQKSILKSVNSTWQNNCISRSKADLELLSLKN